MVIYVFTISRFKSYFVSFLYDFHMDLLGPCLGHLHVSSISHSSRCQLEFQIRLAKERIMFSISLNFSRFIYQYNWCNPIFPNTCWYWILRRHCSSSCPYRQNHHHVPTINVQINEINQTEARTRKGQKKNNDQDRLHIRNFFSFLHKYCVFSFNSVLRKWMGHSISRSR